jgi:hypothetical protein
MGLLDRTDATLRFFGDALDPDEITERLGGAPTVGVRKGGVWLTSRGAERIARRGSWRLNTDRRQPGDLDGQITEIFALLTSNLAPWAEFAARYRADIFCGLWLSDGNQEIGLRPETMAAVGARGLALNFDIYGAEMD